MKLNENGEESCILVPRKGQNAHNRIDDPTKKDFAGGVAGIPLSKQFQRGDVLWCVGVVGILGA